MARSCAPGTTEVPELQQALESMARRILPFVGGDFEPSPPPTPDRAPFRRSRAAALWCPSSRSRCSAMLWRAPRAAIVEPPPPPPVLPAAAATTAAAAAAAAASGGLSSTSSASGSAAAVARCAARAAVRRSAERAATAAGCAAAAAGRFLAAPGAAGAALAGRYWSRWTSVHGRPSSTAGSLRHACCLYVAGRASR